MFASLLSDTGGVNTWHHNRVPTPLDHQPVIRMNRDTLYSAALVDLTAGARLTVPDGGERYLSTMVVNQDHYINEVFYEPGDYELTEADFDTPYVLVGARTLVDPADPEDVAVANALQDQLRLRAGSSKPFELPEYDEAGFTATRKALLELSKGYAGFDRAFGRRDAVDPVRHLIATAAGWGGLPERDAYYFNVNPGLPVGEYKITVREVPVDGFWSISLYNAAGYFEASSSGRVSINNLTAARDPDGSVTVHFVSGSADRPNSLQIMDGWNYLIRLYRPRPEILSGAWTFPDAVPAD